MTIKLMTKRIAMLAAPLLLVACSDSARDQGKSPDLEATNVAAATTTSECSPAELKKEGWEVVDTGTFEYQDEPKKQNLPAKGDAVTVHCKDNGGQKLYSVDFTEWGGMTKRFKEFSKFDFAYVSRPNLLPTNNMTGDAYYTYLQQTLLGNYSYLIGSGMLTRLNGSSAPAVAVFVPIKDGSFAIVICNLDEMPCEKVDALGARQGGVIHGTP